MGEKAPPNKTLILLGAAVGVVVVGLSIGLLFGSGPGKAKPNPEPSLTSGQPTPGLSGGAAKPVDEDPFSVLRRRAESVQATTADMLAYATEATRRADAAADPSIQQNFRSKAETTLRKLLEKDPDHADARERLGFVRFDGAEAQGFARDADLSQSLRSQVADMVIELEEAYAGKPIPNWIPATKDPGRRWKDMRVKVAAARELAQAGRSDPFYAQAQSAGQGLARELASHPTVSFVLEGVEGQPFMVEVVKPYVFLVQRGRLRDEGRIVERFGANLLSLLSTFDARFGRLVGVPTMNRSTPVVILRDSKEYTKYLRLGDARAQVTSGAHFEPGTNRLVCYLQTSESASGGGSRTVSPEEQERNSLFHEGTHQILHFSRTQPSSGTFMQPAQAFWFDEGIAEYFGGHSERYDEARGQTMFVPGTINLESVGQLESALASKALFKLDDLLGYLRAHENRDRGNPATQLKRSVAYAQGWAMVFFLTSWRDGHFDADGQYAADFLEYLKLEISNRSGPAAFDTVFGKYGRPRIEQEFLAMVDVLVQAKKNGKIVNGRLMP